MAGKVFLNYRRADADAWADRLFERLIHHFPRENVFMDIAGHIPYGFSWADWLDSQVAGCDLMLVLIGRSWIAELNARSETGELDYVRVEIESALRRRIPVVPVLLGDAPFPRAAELPETMHPLLGLQAARLQRTSFDTDAEALAKGVARSIALARGDAANPGGKPPTSSVQPLQSADGAAQLQAEGRIKVEAKVIHGAPDAWFKPGGGKSEWFKDIEIGPEMVVVPAGEFMMGSNDYDDEKPPHKVAIGAPFAVSRCAITFAEWDAAGLPHTPDDQGWGRGRRPVINVSWEDAGAYASWLSEVTGRTYRLLSEAEWEYSCRAGTATKYSFGDRITRQQAHFSEGKWGSAKQTTEVGTLPPNVWGLYEMHGNVWEWCEDHWHENYKDAPHDGTAWRGGDTSMRVVRGGCWFNSLTPVVLRSANREADRPNSRSDRIGFRLARLL
jgi:formylglycine-generating enzyme required for sulfatase activity